MKIDIVQIPNPRPEVVIILSEPEAANLARMLYFKENGGHLFHLLARELRLSTDDWLQGEEFFSIKI